MGLEYSIQIKSNCYLWAIQLSVIFTFCLLFRVMFRVYLDIIFVLGSISTNLIFYTLHNNKNKIFRRKVMLLQLQEICKWSNSTTSKIAKSKCIAWLLEIVIWTAFLGLLNAPDFTACICIVSLHDGCKLLQALCFLLKFHFIMF